MIEMFRPYVPEVGAWYSMRNRCLSANNRYYKDYGGRGITICERWLNNLQAFLDDMGPKPTRKHTLDRIDNNKGYSPENCRWATPQEQRMNQRPRALGVSGYRNIDYRNGFYRVRMTVGGKQLNLGSYDNIEEAQSALTAFKNTL